jgi:hypothetical protein
MNVKQAGSPLLQAKYPKSPSVGTTQAAIKTTSLAFNDMELG